MCLVELESTPTDSNINFNLPSFSCDSYGNLGQDIWELAFVQVCLIVMQEGAVFFKNALRSNHDCNMYPDYMSNIASQYEIFWHSCTCIANIHLLYV